jgi:hypothetical protein
LLDGYRHNVVALEKTWRLEAGSHARRVTVAILSATRNVIPFEITSISGATSKIMSPVLACWHSSSFTLQEMPTRAHPAG